MGALLHRWAARCQANPQSILFFSELPEQVISSKGSERSGSGSIVVMLWVVA
jgi:hypothetical protein